MKAVHSIGHQRTVNNSAPIETRHRVHRHGFAKACSCPGPGAAVGFLLFDIARRGIYNFEVERCFAAAVDTAVDHALPIPAEGSGPEANAFRTFDTGQEGSTPS